MSLLPEKNQHPAWGGNLDVRSDRLRESSAGGQMRALQSRAGSVESSFKEVVT